MRSGRRWNYANPTVNKPGLDVFGNSHANAAANPPLYECVNCHRQIASNRYAPHLEKCLGLTARSSSRVAKQKVTTNGDRAAGSPFSYAGDSSGDEGENKKKKRKLVNGSANGNGNGKAKVVTLLYRASTNLSSRTIRLLSNYYKRTNNVNHLHQRVVCLLHL